MATSMSIREIDTFDIPEELVTLSQANVPLGSIVKTARTLTIDGILFEIYEATFTKDVSDNITVYLDELDTYKEISSYKKRFSFNIYYDRQRQMLFSEATTPVTKSFLKVLKVTPGVDVSFHTLQFDLQDISNRFDQTKGIRFNSDDQGVHNKSFSGDQVDENDEALAALQNQDATQIIGVIDILQHSRTVMLTQSGTIMLFSNLHDLDAKGQPMLEFTVAALDELGIKKIR